MTENQPGLTDDELEEYQVTLKVHTEREAKLLEKMGEKGSIIICCQKVNFSNLSVVPIGKKFIGYAKGAAND